MTRQWANSNKTNNANNSDSDVTGTLVIYESLLIYLSLDKYTSMQLPVILDPMLPLFNEYANMYILLLLLLRRNEVSLV